MTWILVYPAVGPVESSSITAPLSQQQQQLLQHLQQVPWESQPLEKSSLLFQELVSSNLSLEKAKNEAREQQERKEEQEQ